jgi:hypothetical protein
MEFEVNGRIHQAPSIGLCTKTDDSILPFHTGYDSF